MSVLQSTVFGEVDESTNPTLGAGDAVDGAELEHDESEEGLTEYGRRCVQRKRACSAFVGTRCYDLMLMGERRSESEARCRLPDL